jgi:putrescine transport system permease protein
LIGKVLWEEFFANRDWPTASAVAVALLVLLVGLPGVALWLAGLAPGLAHRKAGPMLD